MSVFSGIGLALGVGLVVGLAPGCTAGDCDSTSTCGGARANAGGGDAGPVYPEVPPPPGCDPTADAKDAPACAIDAYALFVDSVDGSNANAGGRDAPLRTLAAATDPDKMRGRPRIYVCGSSAYTDSVNLPPNVSVIGGFECKTWRYSGERAKLAPPADLFVLRVTASTNDTTLSDLDLIAADASAPGGSSVALLAVSSKLTLRRVTITAGEARDAPPASAAASNHAPTPLAGTASTGNAGGAARECVCPVFGKSLGGEGGDATMAGTAGSSEPVAAISFARDSAGGAGSAGLTCTKGGAGSDGAAGAGGQAGDVPGSLTMDGWTPARGSNGAPGSPGAGGGGGGGTGSAGGGGGACGGCGGAGGVGGVGGGGSIALAALSSDVKLFASSLTTSAGGAGSVGGQGENGAAGGAAGEGACAGGGGGSGGGGGGGAGGAGGVSAPIVRAGGSLEVDDATTLAPGKAGFRGMLGVGGAGGDSVTGISGELGAEGVAGVATPILEL